MTELDLLRQTAKADRSVARLRELVVDLLSRGVSKESVLADLRELMLEFRAAGDEWLEDVITDTAEIVPEWPALHHSD